MKKKNEENNDIQELRDFNIKALTNAGYYNLDLEAMKTEELNELYYKELKKNVQNLVSAKKSL